MVSRSEKAAIAGLAALLALLLLVAWAPPLPAAPLVVAMMLGSLFASLSPFWVTALLFYLSREHRIWRRFSGLPLRGRWLCYGTCGIFLIPVVLVMGWVTWAIGITVLMMLGVIPDPH